MTMKLSDTRFHPADFVIGRYVASVPAETTLRDVMEPEYFGNCLDRMRPGMEIIVLSEDFALDAKLRVLTVGKMTVKLRVLDVYAGEGIDVAENKPKVSLDNVDVNFGGPNHKWRYVHSGKVIEHGFSTKEEAEDAALKYVETSNG